LTLNNKLFITPLILVRTAYNCRQQGQMAVCCAPQTREVYLAPLDYIWLASSKLKNYCRNLIFNSTG